MAHVRLRHAFPMYPSLSTKTTQKTSFYYDTENLLEHQICMSVLEICFSTSHCLANFRRDTLDIAPVEHTLLGDKFRYQRGRSAIEVEIAGAHARNGLFQHLGCLLL